MSPPLNVFQKVFGLSLLSNAVNDCQAPSDVLQQKLAQALAEDIPARIGSDWEVVWGPVIWKQDNSEPSTKLGNAWYVAKSESVTFDDGQNYCTYVLAIAGTAGLYDWIREDLGLLRVVNMNAWFGPGGPGIKGVPVSTENSSSIGQSEYAFVSNGFANAVHNLLNTTPLPSSPGASQNLPEFLGAIPAPSQSGNPLRLVVTGHSLGGALAPTLSFALALGNGLGKFSQADVRVYPTAGPTPGNQSFANQFQKCFPPPPGSDLSGYQFWNCNIANKFDIVPQAYCNVPTPWGEQLSNIPTIYGQPTGWMQLIRVKMAVKLLETVVGTTYYPLSTSHFDGGDYPTTVPLNMKEFLNDAYVQHVDAYTEFVLGIPRPPGVCPASKGEQMANFPVFHYFSKVGTLLEEGGVAGSE